MTLALYLARRFVWTFLYVFAGFFIILFFIDVVEQIRRFARFDLGLGPLAELALLNVPASVYRILPLIVILASIALFLALARSSELVVIRASGRSALRMLVAPVVAALIIGVVAVAVFNPIVAGTTKRYEALSGRYQRDDNNVLSISREGFWLRQGGPDGQTVIRADRSNPDGTTLFGVTFLSFSPDGGPFMRIEADEATLGKGVWTIANAKEWRFTQGENPEQTAQTHRSMTLPSDLTADQIRDSFGTPSAIPIWQLPAFITALERAGFSPRKHRVWLQMELALPLLLATMVLVGAGFTMRHARSGRTGMMVLLAIIAGFSIFLLRNFAQVLGETGQIPILVSAWSPPTAAMLFSLSLLLHLEDG
ncbi:MAG: LPS export ABC transporter permease LptG [Rhodobacteraceae bacterium]|nr:LPS export ABC transporter permease LptG [Paracoccaceae bacterium]MCP5340828.1 LPS export ABC transporter permease LptG [Paracoccaceae bacterium]